MATYRSNVWGKVYCRSCCRGRNGAQSHLLDIMVVGGGTVAEHCHKPLYQLRQAAGNDTLIAARASLGAAVQRLRQGQGTHTAW